MEAFNVPYCGIDLNQAIGMLEFIKSNPFGLDSVNSTSFKISGDICVIHVIIYNGYVYGNYTLTSLKGESFNTTIYYSDGDELLHIIKSGTTIELASRSIYGANGVIYEFNFA